MKNFTAGNYFSLSPSSPSAVLLEPPLYREFINFENGLLFQELNVESKIEFEFLLYKKFKFKIQFIFETLINFHSA